MERPYLNLLDQSFPGIKDNIARCAKLGFSWENGPVFVKEKNGEPISHAAAFLCPVLINRKWHKMAAIHAVCTDCHYRQQGFASELIQKALAWAQGESDFQILFTEIPVFYEKLGFHIQQEHRFYLEYPHPIGSKSLLPLISPKDNDMFLRCFRQREPLSQHFWVEDRGAIASFNTLFATYPSYWSLYYSSEFDGLLSWLFEGDSVHILDVIAHPLPSLSQILSHLPQPVNKIYFYFPPDRLEISTTAESHLYDKGYLMIHGDFQYKQPFMIAPLSRC